MCKHAESLPFLKRNQDSAEALKGWCICKINLVGRITRQNNISLLHSEHTPSCCSFMHHKIK